MRSKKDCTLCAHLKKCRSVSSHRLETGYTCYDWQKAEAAELEARKIVIREFGPTALRYALHDEDSVKPRSRRR